VKHILIEIEDDVLHVLKIYGRAHTKVTENDILAWFKGQYAPTDIRRALRSLEDDRKAMATSETYWSVVR
jgi:hypothetical protein